MAKQRRTKPRSSIRSDRLEILDKSLAIADIFRQSDGKKAFTIATLQTQVTKKHPKAFPSEPNASTITRFVEALIDCGFPIEKNSPAAMAMSVAGSPKQVRWIFNPGRPGAEALEQLSDVKERVRNLIGLAAAVEVLAPLEGLPVYDGLVALLNTVRGDARTQQTLEEIHRDADKYALGGRRKKRDLPTVDEQRRERLRIINYCIEKDLRLEVVHKHQYGQAHEKKYVVEPRKLARGKRSIYLYHHLADAKDLNLRQFKLDRIVSVRKLNDPCQLEYGNDGKLTGRRWPDDVVDRPPLPLDEIFSSTIHDYFPRFGEEPVTNIVIEVRNELANWVIEEQLNPKQDPRRGKLRDGTDGLIVKIPKAYLKDIVPRLLGLGAHATAIQPPELVAEVRAQLRAAVDRYEEPRDPAAHEGGKPAAPRSSRRRSR